MSLMKAAQLIERFIFPVVRVVHKGGLIILMALMALTVTDVIGRKYFLSPITGAYEITQFMLALLVFSALAYTQIQKGHISMEVLVSRFSPKARMITESIVYLISLILVSVLTWQLAMHAKRLWLGNNVSGVLQLPVYPFVIAVTIGSLLLCFVFLVDFLVSLNKVRGK